MKCPHCGKIVKKFVRVENELIEKVKSLHGSKLSLREIEKATGVSYSTIGRMFRKMDKENDQPN